MITELEKRIYNSHLIVSRKVQNKPFRLRKKFDDLSDDKIVYLQKLYKFFISYENVDMDDFFMAPHKIWSDGSQYPLEFYTTHKAKKAYSQYMKEREVSNPDTLENLIRLKEGLKFIFKFCKEKGLTFENYMAYKEEALPCVVDHLKNHKINFYVLHSLGVSKMDVDKRTLDFIFGDFYQTFQKTKNKFHSSKTMKEVAKKIIDKLKKYE